MTNNSDFTDSEMVDCRHGHLKNTSQNGDLSAEFYFRKDIQLPGNIHLVFQEYEKIMKHMIKGA